MLSVVTYALCKKLISESATGIKSIEVDEHGDLVFILANDTRIPVDLPFKVDALDIQFIEKFPISNISISTIYCKKTGLTDPTGEDIYGYWMYIKNNWQLMGKSGIPMATTTEPGLVKLDGLSLVVNQEGQTGVSTDFLKDQIENQVGSISNSDVDNLFN